jgi:integrase
MPHHQWRGKYLHMYWRRADGTHGSKSRNPETGQRWTDEKEGYAWAEEMEWKERLGLVEQAETPAEDITVAEWFATWWQGLDLGLRSRGNYAYLFRAHVLPEWGHWKLGDIKASDVNAWEQRMLAAGYARGGVASGARTRLATLLGDAVIEGLIDSNPALRQRHRGRRSGVGTGGRGKAKRAVTPLQVVLLSERLAILSGRDEDFVFGVTLAWGALRWGEAIGLQRPLVLPGKIRIDWQLVEDAGRFYLLPPKDDSHRDADIPPFLQGLLSWVIQQHPEQRCACEPRRVDGQDEQPCQGGPFVFLGPERGHLRNSNYARRFFSPAADGRYPTSKGVRGGAPVHVNVEEAWPGTLLPAWPAAVRDKPYEVPRMHGYQRRPLGLGVNVASSRADLVAYARSQGADDADSMTRQQIIDRFIRSTYAAEDASHASWWAIMDGLTPHEFARHGHSSWLMDLSTPLQLRDDRMGHVSPEMRGMRGTYSHPTETSRVKLRKDLQTLWDEALAQRAGFGLHSPVALVDRLLAPFRDGKRKAVSPFPSLAKVVELRAQTS